MSVSKKGGGEGDALGRGVVDVEGVWSVVEVERTIEGEESVVVARHLRFWSDLECEL